MHLILDGKIEIFNDKVHIYSDDKNAISILTTFKAFTENPTNPHCLPAIIRRYTFANI